MDRFTNFFKAHKTFFIPILAVIITIVIAILLCYFLPYCSSEIVEGFFILAVALITAIFAIHKYQSEQRTLRLQKIYFEDTLLGQAKSIEEMMSQTNKNMLLTENLFNLTINVLNQQKVDIDIIKNDIIAIFDSTSTNMGLDIFTTDFKKETISKLLHDSGVKRNALPTWIKKFEEDTYRFSAFLQSQIIILKTQANRLTESNKKSFLKVLHEILGDYVQENYSLIKRHYILFSLLSEIVLEFSSENYTTIKKISAAFKKEKILKITKLFNETFNDVIVDFESVDIGKIAKEDATKLNERIKCAWEKIARDLYASIES